MSSSTIRSPSAKPVAKVVIITLMVLCIGALAIAANKFWQFLTYQEQTYEAAKLEMQQLTRDAAGDINQMLAKAIEEAEVLARRLSSENMDEKAIKAGLRGMLERNDFFFGGTITFSPYGFEKDRRLYSAYYSKSGPDEALEYLQLDELYDYTLPDYDWYVVPMEEGNRWGEPYWDEAGRTYMVTYSALFYKRNRENGGRVPNGVVTIDISMAEIRDIIESLDIGPSGFGAMTTRDGNYLYHPNYNYVLKQKNLLDVAKAKNDPDRFIMAESAAKLEGGVLDHISTTTGQMSWMIWEPVPISGWSLQNTFIKDDVRLDVDKMRHQLVVVLIGVIVFLVSFFALVIRIHRTTVVKMWWLSGIASAAFGAGIAAVWYLALAYHAPDSKGTIKVADKGTLQHIMVEYRNKTVAKQLAEPIFVPTGIHIDAMEFVGANDILIAGRIWQRYTKDFPVDLQRGVMFAHAKGVRMAEIDRQALNGHEVIQWRFQAEVRVDINYSRYPLEVERIGLQFLPLGGDDNVQLVPDLDAYKLNVSTLKPGVDKEVFIPGWKLTESMFAFKQRDVATSFGVAANFDRDTFPELHFEIGLKRVFIDAFISNLTPLIVVMIALFALNLLGPSIEVGRVLSICMAVFFVVVFSHLDIRKGIASGEIFYLEYVFFIIYLAIIIVPINALRVTMEKRSNFYDYRDGIIPKAAYWPGVLSLFFIISVIKFY